MSTPIILFIVVTITILSTLFLIIYSCNRISTAYDKIKNDEDQESFIRNYQSPKTKD